MSDAVSLCRRARRFFTLGPLLAPLAVMMSALVLTPAVRADSLNFVVVHVDDLGWADVGCYGSEYFHTPHIDALAERGVRFTQGYAAAAVCSPTRAALLTGRYPARIGITDWIRATFQGGTMPEDGKNPDGWVEAPNRRLAVPENPLWLEHEEITIAEALAPLGYTSIHIGKWHLGMEGYYPEDLGFDFNIGGSERRVDHQPPRMQFCIPERHAQVLDRLGIFRRFRPSHTGTLRHEVTGQKYPLRAFCKRRQVGSRARI